MNTIFERLQTDAPLVTEVHGAQTRPTTGRQLAALVARARGTLRARGVAPGDRVVLIAPNSARWVAADLAILAEGAIAVPLYTRQDPAELDGMIADCTPALVIGADGLPLDDLFAGDPVDEPPRPRSGDDVVTLVYTSGTSGEPKGVMLTAANVGFMLPITARELEKMLGSGQHRVFHYLPLCFAGSRIVLWTCLFRGNEIHLSTDLANLAQELKTAAPQYCLNVPALLDRIKLGVEAKLKERRTVWWLYRRGLATRFLHPRIKRQIGENLECLICGSAALSPETQRWFEAIGIPVYQVYGLTETTAIVTMDEPGAQVPGRVGRPIDGIETRLGDQDELQVRGPNVFAGYYNRPEATAAAFEDGWFRTGDQVEVVGGNVRIVGRVKNLLVPSSGHNVAPEPLEERLLGVPGVEQAMVVGHGRPFLAAILTGDVDPAQVQAALDAVNAGLPHYRRIRKVHVTAERFTPENGLLTANQKLRRRAVEERFAATVEELYR